MLLSACQPAGESAADGGQTNVDRPSQEAMDWRSQYDLGIRLLNEGNYEEAILAFTAAIEIEPKKAMLYIARGDACAAQGGEGSGENAASDYGQAVTLLTEWYGGDAWQDFENGAQAGMLPENMTYEDAVKRAVEAYQRLAEEYAAAKAYEAAAEAVKKTAGLLDGCLPAEENGGTPGILRETLEQLKNQLSELLEDYEKQAAGGALNAYGATIFEEREGYRAYDTLSGEEQARIERLIEIARSGNVEALEAELPDSSVEGGTEIFYTSWDNWRLRIQRGYSESAFASEQFPDASWLKDLGIETTYSYVSVELREENGAAYACVCDRTDGITGWGSSDDDRWYTTGTSDGRIWASGGCADWQWEGPVSVSGMDSHISYREGEFHSSSEFRWTESGAMSGGVREGGFTYNWSSTYTSPNYEDSSEESETVVYHNGISGKDGFDAFYTVTGGTVLQESYESMFWQESVFW